MSQLSREQQLEELESDYLLHEPKLPDHFSANPNSATTLFEEDLDNNPHSHFLSPVHMYESWDDSDDDDDDDCQFDAGITDFALFSDDYNRAKEQDIPLSSKWYDRAVARTRAELADRPISPFDSDSTSAQHDAVPSLTPDTSPRLADDLEFDSADESTTGIASVSLPYRTKIVTPADLPDRPASAPIDIPRSRFSLGTLSESAVEDEEFADPAAPAFLLYRHSQRPDRRRNSARPAPPPMRPGMSAGNRTLSGKLHVWRRPSWDLHVVYEEREEEMAQDDSRGRGRGDGALRKKKGMQALRG
jgi:hypothetical protein